MSATLTGRPAAMCLGIGMAVLASVSFSSRNAKLWHALRHVSRTCPDRRGLCLSSAGRPSNVQLLPCVKELEQIDRTKRSKQTITVVQVREKKGQCVCDGDC